MEENRPVFSVPKTNHVQIVVSVSRAVPTGRQKTISNPDRLWFQFWKPKTTTIPEVIYENYETKQYVPDMKEGDAVRCHLTRVKLEKEELTEETK